MPRLATPGATSPAKPRGLPPRAFEGTGPMLNAAGCASKGSLHVARVVRVLAARLQQPGADPVLAEGDRLESGRAERAVPGAVAVPGLGLGDRVTLLELRGAIVHGPEVHHEVEGRALSPVARDDRRASEARYERRSQVTVRLVEPILRKHLSDQLTGARLDAAAPLGVVLDIAFLGLAVLALHLH